MVLRVERASPWRVLIVLCVANFLILLDTTIVNTAAPDIMSSLDAGIDEVLWVLNGYLLAFASLLIVFGRLGDLLGSRRLFVAGLAWFTVASLFCALSRDPGQLIAVRIAQGIGAAALLPQAIVLISAIFPPARRGAAFGIFTAVAGIAAVCGPTLGGLLITGLGWQSIFYLTVPVGLAGLIFAIRLVPDVRPARRHRFDVVGLLLAGLGLVGIVFGLVEGERYDWGTVAGPITIPGLFTVSAVLLVLFVLWERKQPEPLLPLGLFRDRGFTIATVLTLIFNFSLYGLLLVFVIETQTLLGMTPLMSGVAALPWTVALSAVAPIAGRLTDRLGGRLLLVIGFVLFALGILGVGYLPSTSSTAAVFVLPLIAIGVGMGMALAPMTTEAMRGVVPEQTGAASGVLNTARQVGAAFGAAVVGAVLQNRLSESLHEELSRRMAGMPDTVRDPLLAGVGDATRHGLHLGTGQNGVALPRNLPHDVADRIAHVVRDAFEEAFIAASRPTLGMVGAVILVGGMLALFIRRAR